MSCYSNNETEIFCGDSSYKKVATKERKRKPKNNIKYTYECWVCKTTRDSKNGIDVHILQQHSSIDYNLSFDMEKKCKSKSWRAAHFAADARRQGGKGTPTQQDFLRLYKDSVIRTIRVPIVEQEQKQEEEQEEQNNYDDETMSDISEDDSVDPPSIAENIEQDHKYYADLAQYSIKVNRDFTDMLYQTKYARYQEEVKKIMAYSYEEHAEQAKNIWDCIFG
jgi:hypothetical protein